MMYMVAVLGFRQGIREAEMAKDSSKSDPHGADAAQSMESK